VQISRKGIPISNLGEEKFWCPERKIHDKLGHLAKYKKKGA
jgi:hypothetical protein